MSNSTVNYLKNSVLSPNYKRPKVAEKVERVKTDNEEPVNDVDDIATDSMISELDITNSNHVQISLSDVIQDIYDLPESNNPNIIRMSSNEIKLLDTFIKSVKDRSLKNNSIGVSKLMRYCTVFMVVNHGKVLKKAIKDTLTKKDSKKLFK
jgi:hypothetical protein